MTAAIMILMVGVTGRVVARFGVARVSVTGLAVLAAGIGWLSLAPADGSFAVDVLPASLVAAAGMSLAYIPVMMAALWVRRRRRPALHRASSTRPTRVGSALGLAAVTAVAAANGADGTGDLAAMTDGFQAALAAAAAIAAAGALAALSLVARRRRALAGEGSAQPV